MNPDTADTFAAPFVTAPELERLVIVSPSGGGFFITRVPWLANVNGRCEQVLRFDISLVDPGREVTYLKREIALVDLVKLRMFLRKVLNADDLGGLEPFQCLSAGLLIDFRGVGTVLELSARVRTHMPSEDYISGDLDYDELSFSIPKSVLVQPLEAVDHWVATEPIDMSQMEELLR